MEKMLNDSTGFVIFLFLILCIVACVAMVFDSIAQKARASRDILVADYRERRAEKRKKRAEEPKPKPEDEP